MKLPKGSAFILLAAGCFLNVLIYLYLFHFIIAAFFGLLGIVCLHKGAGGYFIKK